MQDSSQNESVTATAVSRRRFITAASVTAAALMVAPRRLLAADGSIVGKIKDAAAMNKIAVQTLRGNISVLGSV